MLASYLIPFGVLFFRYYSGQDFKQASGPQVWLYTILKNFIFTASYYCPFALIRGLTRVSVRVCSIAVDSMGPRGVTSANLNLVSFDALSNRGKRGYHLFEWIDVSGPRILDP